MSQPSEPVGTGPDPQTGSPAVEPAPAPEPTPEPAPAPEPAPELPATAGPARSRRGLAFTVAAVWLLLDVVTKAIAVAELTPLRPVELVDGVLELDLLRNAGSAFSLATGYTAVLSLVAVAVVVVVVRIAGRLRSTGWAVAFGLLLGGATGNLGDRLFREPGVLRGHVVDFIVLPHWPVFNIADTGITIAAVMIVVLSLLGRSYDGTRTR